MEDDMEGHDTEDDMEGHDTQDDMEGFATEDDMEGRGDELRGRNNEIHYSWAVQVKGLEDVCSIAAASCYCVAATQSGEVFSWGCDIPREQYCYWNDPDGADYLELSLQLLDLGGVRARCVCAGDRQVFAIGQDGELFSWDSSYTHALFGDDHHEDDLSRPKRVEALRGVRVKSVSVGYEHSLALTEEGHVYAWGVASGIALSANNVDNDENSYNVHDRLIPPVLVKALLGIRLASVAAAGSSSFAISDTGSLLQWGGYNRRTLPQLVECFRDIKVEAVASDESESGTMLVLADDGSVYPPRAWTNEHSTGSGAGVPTELLRIPDLRVTYGL
jgi:alpha-tubulin suppressor-like RCC1 family protein